MLLRDHDSDWAAEEIPYVRGLIGESAIATLAKDLSRGSPKAAS